MKDAVLLVVGALMGILGSWITSRYIDPPNQRRVRTEAAGEEERRQGYQLLADSLDPVWVGLGESKYELSQGELPRDPSDWQDLVEAGSKNFRREWERSQYLVMTDKSDRALLDDLVRMSVDLEISGAMAEDSSDVADKARVLYELLVSAQNIQRRLRWKAVRGE